MAIAVVMMALGMAGIAFEPAMVLAISALSNTGPLATLAVQEPLSWTILGADAKAVLAAAMVLGRLETLAIIALLNPEFWRS
jgi:trk system potassium uptake protein